MVWRFSGIFQFMLYDSRGRLCQLAHDGPKPIAVPCGGWRQRV